MAEQTKGWKIGCRMHAHCIYVPARPAPDEAFICLFKNEIRTPPARTARSLSARKIEIIQIKWDFHLSINDGSGDKLLTSSAQSPAMIGARRIEDRRSLWRQFGRNEVTSPNNG